MIKENLITHYKNTFEAFLENLLPKASEETEILLAAAQYALFGGGKRVRPLLSLLVYHAIHGHQPPPESFTVAAAIELLHTYSLIHDDLPCMDNDDYRRGRLTLHKVYGEAIALLTGDFLLSLPFEILGSSPLIPSEKKVKIITMISTQIGSEGMLGGQVIDMTKSRNIYQLKELEALHRKKTGALFGSAAACGAIISDLSKNEEEKIYEWGVSVGLLFQIINDLMDIIDTKEKHTDITSSDTRNQKATYLSVFGIDTTRHIAFEHYKNILSTLENLPLDPSILKEFLKDVFSKIL